MPHPINYARNMAARLLALYQRYPNGVPDDMGDSELARAYPELYPDGWKQRAMAGRDRNLLAQVIEETKEGKNG